MDGVRERLSEQQFNRLVDYIAKTSCHVVPSCSSMQTACSVVAVELPPATVRTYHYLADPHFAQVFISRFTMVKNRALRKGFPWVPSRVPRLGQKFDCWATQSYNIQHRHKANKSIVTGILILWGPKRKRYSFKLQRKKKFKWAKNKWSAESCFCILTMCRKNFSLCHLQKLSL